MARVLTLHLKKNWFDLIKRGVKLEEYREINDYWMKRLIKNGPKDGIRKGFMAVGHEQFRQFDEVHFAVAYPPKKDKEKWIRIKGPIKIFVGLGRTDWGADPGKDYFVITWNQQKL